MYTNKYIHCYERERVVRVRTTTVRVLALRCARDCGATSLVS